MLDIETFPGRDLAHVSRRPGAPSDFPREPHSGPWRLAAGMPLEIGRAKIPQVEKWATSEQAAKLFGWKSEK